MLKRLLLTQNLCFFFQYETDFNRFWFRSFEEETLFNEIQTELNSLNRDIEPFTDFGDVQVGQVVAASYMDHYYRVKILTAIRGTTNVFYNVMFSFYICLLNWITNGKMVFV